MFTHNYNKFPPESFLEMNYTSLRKTVERFEVAYPRWLFHETKTYL